MNLKNILKEESTVIYVGEEIEKSDTQETLLQGFIVHSPKLGIIDFQEIKSKNLIRRSTPEFVIQLYHIQKDVLLLTRKKKLNDPEFLNVFTAIILNKGL